MTFFELRKLIYEVTDLVTNTSDEAQIIAIGRKLLGSFLSGDAWLPEDL